VNARAAAVGSAVTLLALGAAAAASALVSTPTVPHVAQVRTLFAKDHAGSLPGSDADLVPYSREFEKLLSACKITSSDLADATLFWSGKISSLGGNRTSSLSILQAFTRRVTWKAPRDCWNTFISVEAHMENAAAAVLMSYRHEVTALYVYDHNGANPKSDVELLRYSKPFARILDACIVSAEDNTNLMIHLSDKATELGGRHVTTLKMLMAIARRIDWTKPKIICWDVFDQAEGHAEAGVP
jgi:hypothetical protein